MTPSAKRQAVGLLTTEHGLSVQRACRAVRLSRAAYYRLPPGRMLQDDAVITYRTEVLDAYAFHLITEVRELTAAWLASYNTQRPHDSLGRVPPLSVLPRPTAP